VSDDRVFAALARLQTGQEAIRETLDRLSHDQAVLVDALGNLRKDVLARLEGQQTAGSPARLKVHVDEAVGLLHRRLIALEERMGREQRS